MEGQGLGHRRRQRREARRRALQRHALPETGDRVVPEAVLHGQAARMDELGDGRKRQPQLDAARQALEARRQDADDGDLDAV